MLLSMRPPRLATVLFPPLFSLLVAAGGAPVARADAQSCSEKTDTLLQIIAEARDGRLKLANGSTSMVSVKEYITEQIEARLTPSFGWACISTLIETIPPGTYFLATEGLFVSLSEEPFRVMFWIDRTGEVSDVEAAAKL